MSSKLTDKFKIHAFEFEKKAKMSVDTQYESITRKYASCSSFSKTNHTCNSITHYIKD